ncbi:MAG TPA: YcnI family protein [Solirubrobacterales bacterium]|nr:YcnI family protein [Solirubrobacterales bacterium]
MRRALTFLVALLVTPALPGVAGAHVEVTPSKAPAGSKVNMALEVGHGCDGAATTSLVVLVPKGIESYTAGKVPGWKNSSAAGKMKWSGGPLPDHDVKRFPFTARFYGEKGTEEVFKILQGCEGGASTAWIQQAPPGGAEPENPASVVTLTSTAQAAPAKPEAERGPTGPTGSDAVDDLASASADDAEKDEDDGGSGIILPIIGLVLIAASVTAFVVLQRAKRQR